MKPMTLIFIGRSGSGKGTQAGLLMDKLKTMDPEKKILYIQTGQELREFIKGETMTQKKAKSVYDVGGLMPEFLVIYQWVKIMVEKYTGTEHLVFDGTPRKLHEAGVLNSIFPFYQMPKAHVIHMEVSAEESLKRLLERKRFDDTEADIRERLSWYETEVVPTIQYYKENPDYNYIIVNGEREISDVHAEIVKKLGLE